MRRRIRCCLLLPSLLLATGCTGVPLSGGTDVTTLAAAKPHEVEVPAARPEPRKRALRDSSDLTQDLVYAVLVGEIAEQRGQHRMALTHFMHGARLAQNAELAEMAARAALALDEPHALKRSSDLWLELAPRSMGAHQFAAYARMEGNDIPAATKYLRRLIALAAEGDGDGYMQAARLVSKLEPPERRLQLMQTLTADEPENADAWFASALVAAGADRNEDAVEAARRASDLRPGWNEPRIFLVQILLSLGDRHQARETLESFVAESPDDRGLRLLYAQLLLDEREFASARALFEQMLRTAPNAPDVLFALGVLSLQLEELTDARDYFTRLRDTGERPDDSAFYLGQVEELLEKPETAVSWYREVEGQHALDARVSIARVRAQQGNIERAQELLQQLRDQWPDDAVTLYLIEAEMLDDLDLPRRAMTVYDAAVEAFPGNEDLLYSRGLHAVGLNQLDILERDLKAILAQNPQHVDALNALGYSLADRTDRLDEALSYIERALKLKPEEPAILDSMGWVQYRLGNLDEARTYLRKALTLMPDGEIAAHLGEVLWAQGERDEAWRVWEEALARSPDHEYLLRVIGRHRFSKSDTQP